MNDIQVFKNIEFGEIRTTEINNEPYFVGKDIAKALGYKNTRDALMKYVDEEDKGVAKIDTLGGKQRLAVINESGLYSLTFSSKLPNAKKFKRWVTSEILPTIRKNGMFVTDELLNNPDLAIKVFKQLKQEREEKKKLQLENAQKQQIIGELKPKADYLDLILRSKSLIKIGAIAKDYGMSATKMNKLLHDLGVQYKEGDQWFLYSKYQNYGYTSSETISLKSREGGYFTKLSTKWTQKGRLFLYNLLKDNDIVPLIEQNSLIN